MLRTEDLTAYYDNIPALKGISINVPKGKVVSIIGANGAGKSTLLKAISGLIKSQEGRIIYKKKKYCRAAQQPDCGVGYLSGPGRKATL